MFLSTLLLQSFDGVEFWRLAKKLSAHFAIEQCCSSVKLAKCKDLDTIGLSMKQMFKI